MVRVYMVMLVVLSGRDALVWVTQLVEHWLILFRCCLGILLLCLSHVSAFPIT